MITKTSVLEESALKKEFDEKGFSTKRFPDDLRNEMLKHIDSHIREVGTPFIKGNNPLEQIANSIPDEVWSSKMSRAFRIFPKSIAEKIHKWADGSIREDFRRNRSAVNVVYLNEVEMNPKLSNDSLAIYWRCVRPGKPDAGRPHRDASFWDLEFKEGYDPKIPFPFNYLVDCKKIWIPLKGCIPTTTLQIIPYSHKMDVPTTIEQTEYGRRPSISSAWLQMQEKNYTSPKELSNGSCIIFDMNLVHRGPTHNNTELRISAELNFILN